MDRINLDRVCELNRFSKEPIIMNITERHIYQPKNGTFDKVITCVIKSSTYFKTFRFPTERAFANALNYLENNPNFVPKDLLKFVR